MAKTPTLEKEPDISSNKEGDGGDDARRVCGIVMPIAAMGEDYPEVHWTRVRRIIQKAIERAGMRSQLVWENPEVDVIQTAILQNIYENDVIVCDVSNLNPNVMLETGLRLSTKRPTVIITDKVKRPPFDISTIAYLDYQKDLEYNAIEHFINKLSKKISDVNKAAIENRYHSYIEQFKFEVVQPSSVNVSSDEFLREKLDELTVITRRLVRQQEQETSRVPKPSPQPVAKKRPRLLHALTVNVDANHAERLEGRIDNSITGIFCTESKVGDQEYEFRILASSISNLNWDDVREEIMALISEAEEEFLVS